MAKPSHAPDAPAPDPIGKPVAAPLAQPPSLPGIQMLRGLAAVFVVYNHVAYLMFNGAESLGDSALAPSEPVANLGAMGVDLFFIISGFVMAMSARRFSGPAGAGRFLLLRWIRIAPLYYIYSLLMAIELLVAGIVPMPREILNSLVFVPLLDGPIYHWPIHYLGWTLAFEWMFYLLLALLILNNSRWRTRTLLLVLLILPFATFLLVDPPAIVQLITNPMLWEFAAGVAVYLAWRASWLPANRRWLRALAPVGLVVAGLWAVYGTPGFFLAPRTIDGSDSMMRVLIWGTPALLLFGAMFNVSAQGPARRALLLLGNASYSLYLSHLIVLRVAQKAIEHWPPNLPPDVLLILLMISCLLIGIVAWALVERPLLAFTRRRLLGRPAAAAAAAMPNTASHLAEGRP